MTPLFGPACPEVHRIREFFGLRSLCSRHAPVRSVSEEGERVLPRMGMRGRAGDYSFSEGMARERSDTVTRLKSQNVRTLFERVHFIFHLHRNA